MRNALLAYALGIIVVACSSSDDGNATPSDAGTTPPPGATPPGTTPPTTSDAGSDSEAGVPPPPPSDIGYPGGPPAHSAPSKIVTVPSATYATPCAAIAVAQADWEIDVAPGTYTDSCAIAAAGLRLKGVGGRPKIDLSGTDHPAGDKGIYVVDAPNVVIENLELTGAHISDANGANAAGIRVEADGLRVTGCYIHDNQNGILGGPATASGTIWIETTELGKNGIGNGCNLGGCTHNVYLNHFASAVFQFNWSHDIANDTADKGHLFKSRASNNYLLYNRLTDEASPASYEVDFPSGGLAVLVGNLIQQGPNAGNPTLIAWGEEGASNPGNEIVLSSNTLVNDYTGGTFVSVAGGGTLTAHDNIFAGPGTTATLPADNLAGVDPLFVNRAGYDYHLQAGSPAIGKAGAPGSLGTFSLLPNAEYSHPTSGVARATVKDVGAFEHH